MRAIKRVPTDRYSHKNLENYHQLVVNECICRQKPELRRRIAFFARTSFCRFVRLRADWNNLKNKCNLVGPLNCAIGRLCAESGSVNFLFIVHLQCVDARHSSITDKKEYDKKFIELSRAKKNPRGEKKLYSMLLMSARRPSMPDSSKSVDN